MSKPDNLIKTYPATFETSDGQHIPYGASGEWYLTLPVTTVGDAINVPSVTLPSAHTENVEITAEIEGKPYPDEWSEAEREDYRMRLRNFGAEVLDEPAK